MKDKNTLLMEIYASDNLYILKDAKESKLIYTLKRYLMKVKLFCTQGFPKDGDVY
jgi:hypothetical protein